MVVKLRFAVGVAMIWVVAVAGVSVTAWLAIDRAGRDITGPSVSALPPASIGTAVATTTPGSVPTRTHATPVPSASTTSANPTRSPSPAQPSDSPTAPASSTTLRDRTVTVTGGQVSVRCTGATIQLRIAQPSNGWRVEVERSGPVEVEVGFQLGDNEDAGKTNVKAVCSAGTPVFTVENEH